MYTKADLMEQIRELGIKPEDTLLIHSSMKAIGEVENKADTVLDAFIEYMEPGLLVFPTHTWEQMNLDYTVFDPITEPSCVGILTNLFMKRSGVIRSWNPTHSVAARGRDAVAFVSGEDQWKNPCARQGCWGKLYDRGAKILFIGCGFTSNTIIHGVESWNNVPLRFARDVMPFIIKTPDGSLIDCPVYRHYCPNGVVSQHYKKLEIPMIATGIAQRGKFGDADCLLCDARRMVDLTSSFLKHDINLFINDDPVPEQWYIPEITDE